ncbi:MAG: type IV toxin-antitoxin system AbiEi family antitoxin domain-containing protein [Patescibacteria group bacterium]
MSIIKDIYKYARNGQTVFSLADLSGIKPVYTGLKLNQAIKYLVKKNELIRLSKGLYSFDNKYSIYEFANKFRTPSYISLYTVLSESGVVFQLYKSIFVISQRSEIKTINNTKIIYRKIKDEILLNNLGIIENNGVFKATVERAICDKIYLDNDEYFDNLRSINWVNIKNICHDVYNDSKIISKWISKNTK